LLLQIEDALQLFLGQVGKPFQFMHCWTVLRNTRKWEDWIATKGADSAGDREAPNAEEGQEFHAGAGELCRPIGRDKAKKTRHSEGKQSSESSACIELFQQMAKNKELKNQQEAMWASEYKQVQERQLALKEESTRRQLALQEEQTRIQREQLEYQRLEHDSKIMMMDLSSFSDVAREYFLGMQREILEKRRRGGDNNNAN
jgi:hypothetical protein